MVDRRYRGDMRRMIDQTLGLVGKGDLSLSEAATTFDSHRVPFEVACRVLSTIKPKIQRQSNANANANGSVGAWSSAVI